MATIKKYRLIQVSEDLFRLICEQTMPSGNTVTNYAKLPDGSKEASYEAWLAHSEEWGLEWSISEPPAVR